MKHSSLDRLRAMFDPAAGNANASRVDGFPEFDPNDLPPAVENYFRTEAPQERVNFIGRVRHKFDNDRATLNNKRIALDAEVQILSTRHQIAAEEGNGELARRLAGDIDSKLSAFEQHYNRELHLAKGRALVFANDYIADIENNLKARVTIQERADTERLNKMDTDSLLREILKTLNGK